jgi:hypothetical protein
LEIAERIDYNPRNKIVGAFCPVFLIEQENNPKEKSLDDPCKYKAIKDVEIQFDVIS